ncbi:MAG TPA: biotin/lipoyl-containing protein [Ktedonobacterales bacterium]|nr:biotin/lipoyl-containing protein [Ktedonobacterales bacterium]
MKALAEALEGSEVSELDLTEGGTRILIRRRLEGEVVTLEAPTHPVSAPRRPAARRPRAADGGNAPAASAPDPSIAIVAPLTGVYYSAPSPTSALFTQVGDPVNVGQVVCIIEAMKVFNEIKSEVSGIVTALVPKNGQLVQKGDALIRVKPV